MLLYVSLVWPTKFTNTLSFIQNWFDDWKFMENVRNFNFGKIELNSLFLKIISSYTHAFCSSISMLWDVPKIFLKTVFFLKFLWASASFDWSNLFFNQSKLVNQVFKKTQIWLVHLLFQNFFKLSSLSLRLGKAPLRFFVVFGQTFCKVFLS